MVDHTWDEEKETGRGRVEDEDLLLPGGLVELTKPRAFASPGEDVTRRGEERASRLGTGIIPCGLETRLGWWEKIRDQARDASGSFQT